VSNTPGTYFPLPPDNLNTAAIPALGYMHANCGHCHNPSSKFYTDQGVLMQLRLTVGTLATLQTTTTYSTTVSVEGNTSGVNNIKTIVTPLDLAQSQLMLRFESTEPTLRMPAEGSEVMDPAGQTLLRDWILGFN
jgi:hypothetical protein